jgi:hypothetical protein
MGVDRTRDRGSWRRGNEQHDCHPDDPPASRRRSVVLHVLGLLAASLAAVAALFLIQTALTLLMTVAFVTLLIAGFDWRSNTYSWSSAGIDAEPFTEGRRQLLSRISGALLRCGKSAFRPSRRSTLVCTEADERFRNLSAGSNVQLAPFALSGCVSTPEPPLEIPMWLQA